MSKVVSTLTHGWQAYRKHGCRCDRCRDGHANYVFAENKKRATRLAADPSLAPHGRVSTYTNWGCRCLVCTVAHARHCRARYLARRARAGAT
jgi:hypothetical protein